jgi:flagellar hook-associated protein 2
VALVAALGLALSGFLNRALRQARYGEAITVPVAPSPGYAYLQLAERQGLADARRLALVAVPVRDPQEIVRGYLEGRFAIAPLTTVEALQICRLQPKRCPRPVLILDESRGADKVVVRPSVVNLEGLRGQKVAVVPSSLGPFLLGRALATAGMSLGDVTMVPAQPDAMARQLHRGEVEGAALYVPTGTMSETLAALNAEVTINGLAVSSSSNTLSGAIEGVSLTLKQTTPSPVEVSTASDTQAIRKALDDFVKAYNDLNTYITDQTKYDPEKKIAGKLQGDTATRSLQQQLRGMLQSTSGASATFSSLSRVGIEVQRDGNLVVNSTRYANAVSDLTSLASAFTADAAGDTNDGFGVRFTSLTTALTDGDGLLERRAEGFRSQIKRQQAQMTSLESRVARTEERLLRQYNTLDSNVGKLNSLGSYVSQQVSAWNNSKG